MSEQRVSEYRDEVVRVALSQDCPNPPRTLICSCCGELTQGRQWHNRDTGYGLCVKCADWISQRESAEYMRECYGHYGKHYGTTKRPLFH